MTWYSMQIHEDDKQKESPVLNQYGEPFVTRSSFKIGFDLKPTKEKSNVGKTTGQAGNSLP